MWHFFLHRYTRYWCDIGYMCPTASVFYPIALWPSWLDMYCWEFGGAVLMRRPDR